LDSKFSSSIEIITSIIIIIIIAVFVFVCADLLAMLPPLDLRTLQ
jgi:carbon starvation protein CstA